MAILSPLTPNDIEEELSIAYLHAVCAAAGAGLQCAPRAIDNRGIDAQITAWAPFGAGDGYRHEVDIKVQLKATKQVPVETADHFSYFLDSVPQYDVLRDTQKLSTPRILVVMFLPSVRAEWIDHSHEQLLLRKCAYWVSLRGGAPSVNRTGQTIYLPKKQCLNPQALLSLCSVLSHPDNVPSYLNPLLP